jgi:hypothetical protein
MAVEVFDPPQLRKSPLSCQCQLITVREVAQNRSAEGQGVSWSLGAPLARWFLIEDDSEDDMEGSSMGRGPAKVVKFTGSNRIMTVSELKNLVYQKTLAVGLKRS